MKGYLTASGYMGWHPITEKYILFPTEEEYAKWYHELFF